MVFVSLVIFCVLIWIDLPALIKAGDRRELIAYTVLSVITLIYTVSYARGDTVFSPIKSLSTYVKDTLGLDYELWR